MPDCSKELPGKVAMLDHLKSSHPNLAKVFQPPNINDTRQTNDDSDEVSDPSMKPQVINVKRSEK